ncbi:uncharacterized protein LOC116289371, partial [Actinia tenebrosa]|uniref:Uncharacterized protein LOC116289371 n=1 Tax=Actinia tenebrosa TaxID=6105 RepID=A0A6P8H6V9_ACTTE
MVDLDDSVTNNRKTVHNKASESLDYLRYALDSPVSSPTNDDSYSKAVSRLKHLLHRYNHYQQKEPLHVPATSQNLPGDPSGFIPDPDELTELLNRHYSVVQHLQAKVDFLKDSLGSLKQKTNLICKENQSLLEQLKSKTIDQLMNNKDLEGTRRTTYNDP